MKKLHFDRKNSPMYIMQQFHNLIKKDLYQVFYPPSGTLLEIGAGRGGDIHKWKAEKLSLVVGIEPDAQKEFREAQNRFNCLSTTRNLALFSLMQLQKNHLIHGEAGLNEYTQEKMKEFWKTAKPFDMVSSQFAIHYLFKSESMVDQLIDQY